MNSLPEMQLTAKTEAAPVEAADIQQDIMQHLDVMETETPAEVSDTETAIPSDFKLSLDELKFGRNYTGE